jgi:hypothetical protein
MELTIFIETPPPKKMKEIKTKTDIAVVIWSVEQLS